VIVEDSDDEEDEEDESSDSETTLKMREIQFR